jgi:hypothetical protein
MNLGRNYLELSTDANLNMFLKVKPDVDDKLLTLSIQQRDDVEWIPNNLYIKIRVVVKDVWHVNFYSILFLFHSLTTPWSQQNATMLVSNSPHDMNRTADVEEHFKAQIRNST